MDMPTLAALLGHSKLNMVMRYAHPQGQHQADAVKRLEVWNAAKEIAEVEKRKAQGTILGTVVENPSIFSNQQNEPNTPPNQLKGADRIRTDA
jgi:hypothetical protein